MKNLVKAAVVVLVVTAFSAPVSAEILVYATKGKDLFDYEYIDGNGWSDLKDKESGFLILDVDLVKGDITEAASYWYYRRDGVKWYGGDGIEGLELVFVNTAKLFWVLLGTDTDYKIQAAGIAKSFDIGTDQKEDVAKKLKGYNLTDELDIPDRRISATQEQFKLHTNLTRWSNDPNGGDQGYEAAALAVENYLINKGYQKEL